MVDRGAQPRNEDLPQELYDHIIDTVACDHPRSLLKCSRVSQCIRARAQTHLYHTVSLYLGPRPLAQLRAGYFLIPVEDFIACADSLLVLVRRLSVHTTCRGNQLASISEALLERTWPQMSVDALFLTGELPPESSCDFSPLLLAFKQLAGMALQSLDLLRWERIPLVYIVNFVAGFPSLKHLALAVNVPGSSSSVKMPRAGGHLHTLTLAPSSSVPRWTGLFLDSLLSNGWSADMILLISVEHDPVWGVLDQSTQRAKMRALRVTCRYMPKLARISPQHGVSGYADSVAFKAVKTLPELTFLEFHQRHPKPASCDLSAGAARFLYRYRTEWVANSLPRFLVISMTLLQHTELLPCCAAQNWPYLHEEMSLADSEIQLLVMFAVPLTTVMFRTAAQVEAECWRIVKEAMRGTGVDPSVVAIVDSNRWPEGRLDAEKVQRVIEGDANLRSLAAV